MDSRQPCLFPQIFILNWCRNSQILLIDDLSHPSGTTHRSWKLEMNTSSRKISKENDGELQQFSIVIPQLLFLQWSLCKLNNISTAWRNKGFYRGIYRCWFKYVTINKMSMLFKSLKDEYIWTRWYSNQWLIKSSSNNQLHDMMATRHV